MMGLPELLNCLSRDDALHSLKGIRRGLEKEALRITPEGTLSLRPHPTALGSALTHPHITTDFSEALLEFITPPCTSIDEMLRWMDEIHRFTYSCIEADGEWLWAASMPCIIESDDKIPIARYGSSNSAQMKHIYRVGLSHRYGRTMQTIAGIHYNFSLPDNFWQILQGCENRTGPLQHYKTEKYFCLIRNFRRYSWLLLYLFGASPAVCPTFVKSRQHSLQRLRQHSLYYPYATSLRMGDLGYQSNAQASIQADYNSLEGYITSLLAALTTPHPAYEKIGVLQNGQYRQLNTNLLQIENEFYSLIRPKRVTRRGETPLHALRQQGVEYIEVRSVDINPFDSVGIDQCHARFLETFLLFCLLEHSPPTDTEEYHQIAANQRTVVNEGRRPGVQITCYGKSLELSDCGKALLEKMKPVAALLDRATAGQGHAASVAAQEAKMANPELTPSAHMLQVMADEGLSFFDLAYQQSRRQRDDFLSRPLAIERRDYFQALAAKSLAEQRQLEGSDKLSLGEYLDAYFSQYENKPAFGRSSP